jgi:hypothetical protein
VAHPGQPGGINLRGDFELIVIAVYELRRSYCELPVRLMNDVALQPRIRRILLARGPDAGRAGLGEDREPGSVEETTVSKREPEGARPELKSEVDQKELYKL